MALASHKFRTQNIVFLKFLTTKAQKQMSNSLFKGRMHTLLKGH